MSGQHCQTTTREFSSTCELRAFSLQCGAQRALTPLFCQVWRIEGQQTVAFLIHCGASIFKSNAFLYFWAWPLTWPVWRWPTGVFAADASPVAAFCACACAHGRFPDRITVEILIPKQQQAEHMQAEHSQAHITPRRHARSAHLD